MKKGVCRIFVIGVSFLSALAAAAEVTPERPFLQAAVKAARWVELSGIALPNGMTWPADPADPATITEFLYSGTPGVVIFYLETFYSTGDKRYLDIARKGADHLLSVYAKEKEMSLYEGISGTAFALEETYKATGDMKYRTGFLDILGVIEKKAVHNGRGIEWGEVTDIVDGSAGTGLFLIYASRELADSRWLKLASAAGERLIELGRPENGGLKWAMSPSYAPLMPNFSHGTAGIAYFLARLYEVTKNKEFLKIALAGTKYLHSVAQKDTCLLFHDEPDHKDLFYLGWCHGPVGTSLLFFEMYRLTGEKSWLDWVKKSAQAIMDSGIPEKQTPGFWDNVGLCCGLAGVAEFFLNLHQATGEKAYHDFELRVTEKLLAKATAGNGTLKWNNVETRRLPNIVLAQTGLMQGASGIGLFLLHADGFETGRKRKIYFPDSPFDQ
jgi:lantibiotic modifying enzyme